MSVTLLLNPPDGILLSRLICFLKRALAIIFCESSAGTKYVFLPLKWYVNTVIILLEFKASMPLFLASLSVFNPIDLFII